ncbi:SOS response-associated peptidase [Altererythrobacter aquiaggeris]|uniref:SOS response-associated peptidase n=1 Tax=Aestuarierythrobacter aquiaggeris TaxID=1898396 RepID=UPI003019825E
MCNLYRMTRAVDEIAGLFNAAAQVGNAGAEIYPGYPGYVAEGGRLRQMSWGFPLAMRGKHGQILKPRPVNNARADKLQGGFWKSSFTDRRCLIPVTAWAEAEGENGKKTRSWLSLPDSSVFSIGGIWRSSAEWGDVYSMVMTDAAPQVSAVHHRMPVIVAPEDRDVWLTSPADQAFELCRPWQGHIAIDRTTEPWVKRKAAG